MSVPVSETLVVLCTCPTGEEAERLARALLEGRLAACVTTLPGAQSWYWWKGAVESAHEWLLLIKTTRERYDTLERTLASVHPYEVPEILAFEPSAGLPAYLAWVARETGASVAGEHRA
jgi:periplasmic divalent cation tolerance protein